jgi:hypothetical protein
MCAFVGKPGNCLPPNAILWRYRHRYAKAIFHEEWRKLKREVADPGQTMDIILAGRQTTPQ